jgi:hypothetical protein
VVFYQFNNKKRDMPDFTAKAYWYFSRFSPGRSQDPDKDFISYETTEIT